MKFTLKNRPQMKDANENPIKLLSKYYSDNEDWFEGFQRELQESIKACGKKYCLVCATRREILGDGTETL